MPRPAGGVFASSRGPLRPNLKASAVNPSPTPPESGALSLLAVNAAVYSVLDAQGLHVGNLKRIGGLWKFKAVGYTPEGEVEPGGGPLTAVHNRSVAEPCAQALAAALAKQSPGQSKPGQP